MGGGLEAAAPGGQRVKGRNNFGPRSPGRMARGMLAVPQTAVLGGVQKFRQLTASSL